MIRLSHPTLIRKRPGVPGKSWAKTQYTFNDENPYINGSKTRGYGADSKAWAKFTTPKGIKMNPDWRRTGQMTTDRMTNTKEWVERGFEGHNNDLDIQSAVLNSKGFDLFGRNYDSVYDTKFGGRFDQKAFPEKTKIKPAFEIHNRHKHQFEAAGLDQFSAMFKIPVFKNENGGTPALIKEILPKFQKLIESKNLTQEYLKIAQKDRLFYQDPQIMSKFKPQVHNSLPYKANYHFKSRNLTHLAADREGKSKDQERPWQIWDWDLDEPAWQRWGANMVRNFLTRATFDIVRNAEEIYKSEENINDHKMIAFRSESQNQIVSYCDTRFMQNKNLVIDMRVRWAFRNVGRNWALVGGFFSYAKLWS